MDAGGDPPGTAHGVPVEAPMEGGCPPAAPSPSSWSKAEGPRMGQLVPNWGSARLGARAMGSPMAPGAKSCCPHGNAKGAA